MDDASRRGAMDASRIPRLIAYVRFVFAAAAIASPKLGAAVMGVRPADVPEGAKPWIRFLGSRGFAPAAMTIETEHADPVLHRRVLLLNAVTDAVDIAGVVLWARDQKAMLRFGLSVGALSVAAHVREAQRVGRRPSA